MMINYSWNTPQPIIPPSFPLASSPSKNIFIYFQSLPLSFVALSINSYTQIHKITHTRKIKRAAFCVQVSALSWGMQQFPTESSVMTLGSRGTLLRSRFAIIVQPARVHLTFSWLCVCNCLPLSHHIPPTVFGLADWATSFILSLKHRRPHAPKLPTRTKKKKKQKRALELPDAPLCSRWHTKCQLCRWGH